MALVPLQELLQKHGISRPTYHKLLRKGLLPHYVQRFGTAGKRGATYLYDSEVFGTAYAEYAARRKFGLGIDADERDEQFKREDSSRRVLTQQEKIDFLIDCIEPGATETLTEYDARITEKRQEFSGLAPDDLDAAVKVLLAQGLRPRQQK